MQASLGPQDLQPTASRDGVGTMLRERRIELGLSQLDVANVVKLPPRRIEAMEQERWDELPDGPYLRGFLKNIARALQLDADMLMARVDDSLVRARHPDSILVASTTTTRATLPRRSGPASERHAGRPLFVGALCFAVIAALIAWSGTESFDRAMSRGRALVSGRPAPVAAGRVTGADDAAGNRPAAVAGEAIAPTAPTAGVPAAGAPTAADVASPTADGTRVATGVDAAAPANPSTGATPSAAAAAATPSAGALRFHFNEDAWVEVRAADGQVLMSRLNPAGSDQVVDGAAPYKLVVGNAKGVALEFRGQPVDLVPYTRSAVARLSLS